jgi:hypothetical protein
MTESLTRTEIERRLVERQADFHSLFIELNTRRIVEEQEHLSAFVTDFIQVGETAETYDARQRALVTFLHWQSTGTLTDGLRALLDTVYDG